MVGGGQGFISALQSGLTLNCQVLGEAETRSRGTAMLSAPLESFQKHLQS